MSSMDYQLHQLAQSVSHAEDLEALTRPLLDLLQRITRLESTYLTTIDEVAGVQRILFSQNSGDLLLPEGLEVPWSDTLCRRALEEGRFITQDVPGVWGDSEAAAALKLQTYLSIPVSSADGNLYGTLCGASSEAVAIDSDVMDVLRLFSQLITQQLSREAHAHHTKQRAEVAEKKIDEMSVVASVGAGCMSADNLNTMIQQTADLLEARQLWTDATPFEVIDEVPHTFEAADKSCQSLISDLLLYRNSRKHTTEPCLTTLLFQQGDLAEMQGLRSLSAPHQVPVSVVLICAVADDMLHGGILLLSSEPISHDSSELQMLGNCSNYLSLLADRLLHLKQIEEANKRLTFFAMHDPLTTLPNRRYLIDELGRRLSRAKRTGEQIHIAFIDLDNFKHINDVHGHDVGDDFLVAFANRLNEIMRAGDMAARFGGDEFVLIATAGQDKDIEVERTHLLQRILHATQGLFELPTIAFNYDGPSIGIITSGLDDLDGDQLLSKADEAMYVIKRQRKADQGCADKSGSLA